MKNERNDRNKVTPMALSHILQRSTFIQSGTHVNSFKKYPMKIVKSVENVCSREESIYSGIRYDFHINEYGR